MNENAYPVKKPWTFAYDTIRNKNFGQAFLYQNSLQRFYNLTFCCIGVSFEHLRKEIHVYSQKEKKLD